MRIKHLLLTQYIQRGTVLQKYIDMLKYLAQEQTRLLNNNTNLSQTAMSQRKKKNGQDQVAQIQKRYEQEQNLIEENVTKLIRCILRVVFNKWVIWTY